MRDDRLSPATAEDGHPPPRDTALMTAADVARLLGVPTSWVYREARSGRIPTVTLGRYRRFRKTAIECWLAELERPRRATN